MEFITLYKIRKVVFFILLVGFSFQSQSQKVTKFSKEIDVFLVELDDYLNKPQNDELRQIFKKLSKSFNKNQISINEQKIIRDISQLMLDNKLKPTPYFRDFLESVLFISSDEVNKNKLNDWLAVSKNILINSNSRRLLKFCEFSINFLEKGTLRDSKTLTWSVSSNNFNFKDDNGSPYIVFNSLFDLKCTNRYGSIQIKNTTGKYFIQSNIFHGSKGLVD